METPRAELRQRLSVCQYDNLILYQYFHQLFEELTKTIQGIESTVSGIRLGECLHFLTTQFNLSRHELFLIRPQEELDQVWRSIIRRLELISLFIYLFAVCAALYLFFYFEL